MRGQVKQVHFFGGKKKIIILLSSFPQKNYNNSTIAI